MLTNCRFPCTVARTCAATSRELEEAQGAQGQGGSTRSASHMSALSMPSTSTSPGPESNFDILAKVGEAMEVIATVSVPIQEHLLL